MRDVLPMFDEKEYKKQWAEDNAEHLRCYKQKYYEENKARLRETQKQLKRKNRLWALNELGGQCVDCGATENLEFDHIDPAQKHFKITHYLSSINKLSDEIKKCELRCKKCHRQRSNKQLNLAWHLLSIIPTELREEWQEHHPELEHLQILFDTTHEEQ